MKKLRFIPFRTPGDKGWDEAAELYHNSFPRKELRSEADHQRALADPRFTADGIWLGDAFAGILYHWRFGEAYYVEYFAVLPALRGRNVGSEALASFCRERRVILEIDPPEDDISVRRLNFYRRQGFIDNPHDYIHPSYCRPFEPHRLVLMSRPGVLGDEEADRLTEFVRSVVLKYSEHEG